MYTHPMQKDPGRDSLYELCEKKFKVCIAFLRYACMYGHSDCFLYAIVTLSLSH